MIDWKVALIGAALVLLIGIQGALLWTQFFSGGRLEKAKIGQLDTLTLDASHRSIMVRESGKFCSEPVPDAANTFAKEFAGSLSGTVKGDQAAANLKQVMNTELAKLFERSQGIQALRDGMYRLCEAFLNGAITPATYEDHIGHLTATLNFIVPIELCAKLNREIVTSLAGIGSDIFAQHRQRDNATTKPNSEEQSSEGTKLSEIPKPLDSNVQDMSTTLTSSELLSSKFTRACVEIGADFAGKLSQQMVTRAIAREEANRIEGVLRRDGGLPTAMPTKELVPPASQLPPSEKQQ